MQSELVPVTGGVHLHAHRWEGTGRPFVLVHGLASNARLWDGVAARLAEAGHLVVAVDQRGHGRSDKPDRRLRRSRPCAADLALLVDGLGLDRPVVAGQSWGGNVVLELAADRPASVHGVALRRRRMDPPAGHASATGRTAPASCARPALAGLALSRPRGRGPRGPPSWPDEGIDATLANFEVLADGTVAPWLTLERHLRDPPRPLGARPSGALRPRARTRAAGAGRPRRRRCRHGAPSVGPVAEALEVLPDARVHWFGPPADHDLHAQHPDELAALLLELAR